MSLILDALKKAEQDRHAGQAPVLDELLVRPPTIRQMRRNPQREMALVAGITAAVLFALAGLAYLLWPSGDTATETVAATAQPVATPQAPAAAQATEPAPALRIDPERLAEPVTDVPEDAVDLADTAASQAMTMDELDGDTPQVSPTKPPRDAPPASAFAAPTAPAPIAETITGPAPSPEAPAPQPSPVAQPTPAVAAAPPSAPEPIGARPLKEMPPGFRAEFPKLTVDVHFYNDNPLRRFVIVNGKKYRETDTLVDGPRVVEIAPDGVIVEQRGSKVLIELPG